MIRVECIMLSKSDLVIIKWFFQLWEDYFTSLWRTNDFYQIELFLKDPQKSGSSQCVIHCTIFLWCFCTFSPKISHPPVVCVSCAITIKSISAFVNFAFFIQKFFMRHQKDFYLKKLWVHEFLSLDNSICFVWKWGKSTMRDKYYLHQTNLFRIKYILHDYGRVLFVGFELICQFNQSC